VHDAAAVQKASENDATGVEWWGLRALGLRGRRERGERLARKSGEVQGEGEGGERREGRRAGFVVDGAERWEDEDEEGDVEGEEVRDVGDGERWTGRGWVRRWRTRDVRTYD
jgi:hypothetical protein